MPAKLADALAQLWSFAYQVPAMLGYGQHWPLAPSEAKALGQATEACIKALPKRGRARAVKRFLQMLPWVTLLGTAYIVTYPRVVMTRHAQHAQGLGSGAGSAGGNDEAPAGRASGVPTWADPEAVARLRRGFARRTVA